MEGGAWHAIPPGIVAAARLMRLALRAPPRAQEAEVLLEAGRADEALEALHRSVDEHQGHWEAWLRFGLAHSIQTQQAEKAGTCLNT